MLSYNVGVAGLLWIILALGELAPVGFSPFHASSIPDAIMVNLSLIMLFGVQHSIMPRVGF